MKSKKRTLTALKNLAMVAKRHAIDIGERTEAEFWLRQFKRRRASFRARPAARR